jgi:hypothetical protein
MNVISTTRGFGFSIGTLLRAAQRLLEALQDGTIGPPIVDHLSATFVADFTTQIAQAASLDNNQNSAVGEVSSLTLAQDRAYKDLVLMSRVARKAATFALRGQETILKSEFQVGLHRPMSIDAVLARGRKLLNACQTYATELAPYDWSSSNTETLSSVLDTLGGADRTQESSKDEKQGVTALRNSAARRLYQRCIHVQGIARVVYLDVIGADNADRVEARSHFLLGEFPPSKGALLEIAPVQPSAPVVVAPAIATAA